VVGNQTTPASPLGDRLACSWSGQFWTTPTGNVMKLVVISIPILISVASLIVSGYTLWLTNFRRGRLRMTTPGIVFFGFDEAPKTTAKIFVRTLLYSTATRGQVIEGLFATLHHDDTSQDFTFWGYGPARELSPGGGLYVDKAGVAANHHFVLSVHEPAYRFDEGLYGIEVFARTAGRKTPLKLARIDLTLSGELAGALANGKGVLFERRPNGMFEGHADTRPR